MRDEIGSTGSFYKRSDQRGYRPPKCCIPACPNPRPKGERYCWECAEQIGEDSDQ